MNGWANTDLARLPYYASCNSGLGHFEPRALRASGASDLRRFEPRVLRALDALDLGRLDFGRLGPWAQKPSERKLGEFPAVTKVDGLPPAPSLTGLIGQGIIPMF